MDRICICGHKDNRHADIEDGSKFGCWGIGHCELCRCERFELVKAPKNELVPIEYRELIALMIELQSPSTAGKRVVLAETICKKFGSSGKRPLNEEEVEKALWVRHAEFQNLNGSKLTLDWDIVKKDSPAVAWSFIQDAKGICKQFSTAEVSEERLEKAHSTAHMEWMNYDRTANLQQHSVRIGRDEFMAKAIKAELDGK